MNFNYNVLAGHIIFGAGKLSEIKLEAQALKMKKVLILCTPNQRDLAESAAAILGDLVSGIYDQAVMHVPIETVDDAMNMVRQLGVDGCVAIGGGSTVGLAKAIALRSALPILAVPTTYAGSEMTSVWGLTKAGIKTTGRDPVVLPKTVIYDPELSCGLPAAISAVSGMNAIAHCVEALYSETQNPVTSLMAQEGIRALAQSLPILVAQPENIEARSTALYGAWLSGTVLGAVGMAIHHKLCHTLGGSFNLPHAPVHTVILPQATHFNRQHATAAMTAIGQALQVDASDAAGGLYDLAQSIGAPVSLQDIGMSISDLDKAAEIATTNPYYNPRPIDREGVREILEKAYWGIRPDSQ